MKRGQLIKIVASKPAKGQTGIGKYIGQVVPVVHVHRDDARAAGEVTVNLFGMGKCILNKSEYELVEDA